MPEKTQAELQAENDGSAKSSAGSTYSNVSNAGQMPDSAQTDSEKVTSLKQQLKDTRADLNQKLTQAAATVGQYQSKLDAANARITELTAVKAQNEADEKLIAEKMTRGVTRAQAVAAIKRQRDFDASDYGKMCAERHAARQAGKVWTPKKPVKTT